MGEDGIHAAGKTNLDRPPHLTTVEGAFDKGGHHRPKGADIIEIPAHKIPDFPVQKGIVFFGRFQIFIHSQIGQRLCVAALQGDLVFDIDAVTFTVLLNGFHIVADFPFQADISHQSKTCFRINARHIACIRIPIGVAIFYIEKNDKIIAVTDRLRHCFFPPLAYSGFAFRDNIPTGTRFVPKGSCVPAKSA